MKTKRILSVALTLVMLIGLFPGMGLTASAAGSTTEITPSNTSGTLTITLKIKADQAAPAAPTAASVTINSITLNTITNGEYKMGDGEWQDSPAFTGLTMNTEYTFYQRLKGDEDHNASPASPAANIKTSNHVHSWTYTASGATITATCANGDGGHEGSTTATLTVAAPEHSVFGDAKSAEATITGSIDGVATPAIVYKKGADTLPAAPTDAGTYTANITLGGATASVEYTIGKASITPSISLDGWTYGEAAKTPSVTGNTDNGTVTYTYAVKGSTDFSAAVPANAGDYTVKATVAATNNYNGGEATADFTIAKANQTAPAAPTEESVTINSITLNTITNGEYSIDGTNWQASPVFTGLTMNTTYTFYQRLKADANHNESPASACASISTSNHVHNWGYTASGATITATCANGDGGHEGSTTATLTIVAPALTVYGGTGSAEATITGSIDGVTTPAIVYKKGADTLPAAPTDAGTYTANITLGDATATVEYTIGKASITPSVSLDGWTYGEAAKTPSVTGNTDNGTVTYTYAVKGSTDFSAAVPANAGDYTVKATVAATNNYNGGEATADFTISPAALTVTADAKSKTYGEDDPALTYTASGLVGTDALTGALARAEGENAGSYAILKGTLSAGSNYTINYTGANLTINPAAITITADDKSSQYGADLTALTYTVSGAYKTGDELGVTLNTTASNTANVGEYSITVGWNENTNYTATLVPGKYTITKTGLTVTVSGYTGAYDKAAHGITVDVGTSGATVYYAETELTAANYNTAGSTTAPTYTDAGDYTVYFYVVTSNYNPDIVSGSKIVSISKATMTKDDLTEAQKPTAKTDLIADNTDQALLTAPEALPEGYTKIQYSIDNGTTWTDAIPTGKDPGDYTVLTKYIGDKNHADFEGAAVTASIKTLTVTFEVNGGSAVAAQGVIKGEKATKPADPTKAGNAFDGWFQDATFSVAFDFETPITADMTLYAKWTPNDYSFQTITGTTTDTSHTWTKGSGKDVVITVKLTTEPDNSFAHYVRTEIDGKTVTATAREGSTIVTIKAAELQKLSTGAHTVTIVFDNGQVDVRLTVKPNPSSPATGDTRTTGLWATLTILSGLGIGGVTLFGKKRRKSIGQ